jgi:hypothetical protein
VLIYVVIASLVACCCSLAVALIAIKRLLAALDDLHDLQVAHEELVLATREKRDA